MLDAETAKPVPHGVPEELAKDNIIDQLYVIIDQLRSQLVYKDREIERLRTALGLIDNRPNPLNLTKKQDQVFSVLLKHAYASKHVIARLVYNSELIFSNECALRVHIGNLRKKLEPHGVQIFNDSSRGYFIRENEKRKFLEYLGGVA